MRIFEKPAKNKYFSIFVAIFLFALFLRLYKITAPLWLDELFGFSLAQQGIFAILQNSIKDPHPPLFYVYLWISSGFGTFHNEISLRWLPLICGALTIPVIWLSARLLAGIIPASLITIIAATSPALIFYSQEARPFGILIFLSSLSVYLVIKASFSQTIKPRIYAYWIALSLAGIYCGYSYLMVAGLQLVYLGFIDRYRRNWRISAINVVIGTAIILPYAFSSLRSTAMIHLDSVPLTFWRTLQTILAGEAGRYGFSITHTVSPILFLCLCLMSGLAGIKNRIYLYLLVQSIYPFIAIFLLLTPIVKIRLPLPEAKQFLVILPSIFILASIGLASINRLFSSGQFFRIFIPLIYTTALLWMNIIGLINYWKIPKSPESALVNIIMEKIQPEEEIVSLYYSINYSLGFYSKPVNIYFSPKLNQNEYEFVKVLKSASFFQQILVADEKMNLSQIRKRGNFWVVTRSTILKEVRDSLTKNCQIMEKLKIRPFEAIKVGSCSAE